MYLFPFNVRFLPVANFIEQHIATTAVTHPNDGFIAIRLGSTEVYNTPAPKKIPTRRQRHNSAAEIRPWVNVRKHIPTAQPVNKTGGDLVTKYDSKFSVPNKFYESFQFSSCPLSRSKTTIIDISKMKTDAIAKAEDSKNMSNSVWTK
jgi:hypothetical protein